MTPGESGVDIPEIVIKKPHACANNSKEKICIYSCNIQCLLARSDEVADFLAEYRPHVVMFQETWLDESVPDYICPGYRIISRRDRHPGANRGGILTLQRDDFNGLVHIGNNATEERS